MSVNKRCKTCLEYKTLNLFRLNAKGKYGRRGSCIECCKKLDKVKYKKTNWTYLKNRQLKANFGITYRQYNNMFKKQNGTCAICKEAETAKTRFGQIMSLSVDHCHKTGKVRGLLCNKCNPSLGGFRDREDLLLAAINYLKEHQ